MQEEEGSSCVIGAMMRSGKVCLGCGCEPCRGIRKRKKKEKKRKKRKRNMGYKVVISHPPTLLSSCNLAFFGSKFEGNCNFRPMKCLHVGHIEG